jgi:hypothetical protein
MRLPLPLASTSLLIAIGVSACSAPAPELGFWFERVSFTSPSIGSLTGDDLALVESIARDEIAAAFTGYAVQLSNRSEATYRVRVAQQLRDLRFTYDRGGPAGQSFAVRGFGGSGAVNFTLLASNAVGYASAGTPRDAIVAAIGRGVGRAAVHEFAHQLLPTSPVDSGSDIESYEYGYAGRPQQYWGTLRWSVARPWLDRRLGRAQRNR